MAGHLGDEDTAMSRFLHVPGRPAPAAAQSQVASHPPRGKKYAAGTSKNPVMLATVQVVAVCWFEVAVKLSTFGVWYEAAERAGHSISAVQLCPGCRVACADSASGQKSRTS